MSICFVESTPYPTQVLQAPVFAIVTSEEAQATQAAEDGGLDGSEAAVSLVALGGGRLPPPRGGAIPDGADDLAVGEGLGGGALPDLCRAE